MAVSVYHYCYAACHSCSTDASDERGPVGLACPDTDGLGFVCRAGIANVDVATARGQVCARRNAYGDVVVASGVAIEGRKTDCGVVVAILIAKERINPAGRVGVALKVALQCLDTIGGVLAPGDI